MAITWTSKIVPLNIQTKEVSISATRTDSEDAENPQTFYVPLAPIATAAQKTAVAQEIWDMKVARDASQLSITTIVDSLETALNSNLEARE